MKTLILAGGFGTRLFPLSRENFAKQFIKFKTQPFSPVIKGFPSSFESLFQRTVKRALLFSKPEEIYVITNEKQKFLIEQQLEEMGLSLNIITEPLSKNTLPAIYLGLKTIQKEWGDSIVSILPSDHFVGIDEDLKKAFKEAEKLAESFLVTFGIKPTCPHTGYGYIKPAERVGYGFRVLRFIEKPDKEMAERLIKEGCLWNSGMFVFSTKIFFEECKKYASNICKIFEEGGKYSELPSISVDKGLLEKSKKVAVIPLKSFWSDIGSFESIYELMKKDSNGNAASGEYFCINSKNNLIISNKFVACIDVKDMIIIGTDDVLLVAPRKSSQKIKELVKKLKEKGNEKVKFHSTVYRPWGFYTTLEETPTYKIRLLTVYPGKSLSLHMHYHRNEHWVVVRGVAKIKAGEKEVLLKSGESIFIPATTKHKLENAGKIPLNIIEIQTGEFLDDRDIVRFKDG